MTQSVWTRPLARRLSGVAALLLLAAPLTAQTGGDGFLFKEPVLSLSLRGGLARASAGSDIFAFSSRQFTLGRRAFDGARYAGEAGVRVSDRFHLQLGAAYSGNSSLTEYRDWVDGDDRPIEQTTTFQRVPVTAGLKAYLTPAGRSIGRFAWVPARLAPYVGAGGGAMWYRFRQQGDFINTETLAVFSDDLDSEGWAPAAHGFAGLDLSLTPRIALTTEARYEWARSDLDPNFYEGFDPIDLSGFAGTVGFTLRF